MLFYLSGRDNVILTSSSIVMSHVLQTKFGHVTLRIKPYKKHSVMVVQHVSQKFAVIGIY